MAEEHKKVVRDAVYGYVGITEKQYQLIELPVFQRLRRISQLSFADFVYPDSMHNRFSHCIGAMNLGNILKGHLETSGVGKDIELDAEDYNSIVWAGLLHDIGHLPFSHASEPAFAYFIDGDDDWHDYHVKLGCDIIKRSDFGISSIIGDPLADNVISLIDKQDSDKNPLLHEAMTGVCSIDRLDYLKRDAHHAGTPEYAIIDSERILNSAICCPEDMSLAPVFKKKAIYALEGAILSYFYMYRAIYYHHAVRSAYMLFQDIIWEAFATYDLTNKIGDLKDPNVWNLFDENKLISLLWTIEALHPKLKRLAFGELPKMIPFDKLRSANIGRLHQFINQHSHFDKVSKEKEITRELKGKYPHLDQVYFDSPVVIPYPPSLFADRAVYLWSNDMGEPQNLSESAPYLKDLPEASLRQMASRVYVFPESFRMQNEFIADLNRTIADRVNE